jgi:hypothetical protein
MLNKLERLIDQLTVLQTKLILLAGQRGCGKTKLLHELGSQLGIAPLNVSLELGRCLAAIPNNKRSILAGELSRKITSELRTEDPLLLDNLELLFEPSLQIHPLDLIKRLAHARRVVAAWPGELRDNRLYYAEMTHPEYRDYDADGVVIIQI